MAIIKAGPIVVGIRGTVGGVIFSQNKAGAYCKQWKSGTSKRTEKQAKQRTRMAKSPQQWIAMSESDRELWAEWAALPEQKKINALGEEYELSGYQWFVTLCLWAETLGRSAPLLPPDTGWPEAPTIVNVSTQVSGVDPIVSVEIDLSEYGEDWGVVIFASHDRYGARSVQYAGYRLLHAEVDPQNAVIELSDEWDEVFGRPAVSSKGFFRVHRVSPAGLRSDYALGVGVFEAV